MGEPATGPTVEVKMVAAIDPRQPLPIYVQLKTVLLDEILRGTYGPGEQLPTEHELCARYGISRTPVHRALAELAEDGAILRHRRRGTFVNPHWVSRNASKTELRVIVPEGPWEALVRDAGPVDAALNVVTVPLEDLHQVLVHAVAEGRAPDVALLDSVWVAEFAGSGFLWPLDELGSEWLREEYLPDALDPFVGANRRGDRTMAVQAEADVAGLWYRRDALADIGLEPPHTWGELAEAGERLRRHGFAKPLALPGGSRGGETTTYCLLGMMAANSARALADEAVVINSPHTIGCLEFLRHLVHAAVLPVDVVSYEHDRAPRLLARGEAALSFGGSYEVRTLCAETGLSSREVWKDFGFVGPPQGPRGGTTLVGGMVHGIFRQASNPHLAFRLLKGLSAPQAQVRMSERTGQIASRRSAAELASGESPFLAATASMLDGAVLRPSARTYPRVSTQIQAMLESVLIGRLAPAEAAERAGVTISAITGLPIDH